MYNVQDDHRERVQKSGLPYANLYEYVVKKFTEAGGNRRPNEKPVAEPELREALKQLENELVITCNGHTKAPTIRFMVE